MLAWSFRKQDVALLKIDAEGHEDFVVKSAASVLSKHRVGAILLEAKASGHPERDKFKREFFARLTHVEGFHPYEFYEEVGRSVFAWNLDEVRSCVRVCTCR